MLDQIFKLGVGILTLFLPGVVLLLTVGIKSRALIAGLSAALTVGLVLIARTLTGIFALGFNVLSFLIVTAVVILAAAAIRRLARRRTRVMSPPTVELDAERSDRDERASLRGRTLQLVRALGALTGLSGLAFATWTWQQGLGSWSTPTQEHDTVTHSIIAAYIEHTGNAAPWELAPLSVVHEGITSFYPSGFSSLAALVSNLLGSPLTAMNLVTVAFLAIAWPLSVAALAATMVRLSGLGKGWTELAGGIAALVAAVLYRPGISFAHDGGILPNAAAMAIVPGLVATMLLIGRRQFSVVFMLGIACAGALSLHPSVAVSTALTLIAAWVGLLFTRAGRSRLKASLPPLLTTAAVAVIAALPVLLGILSLGSAGSGMAANISAKPLGTALRNAVELTYLGYFDPAGQMAQVVVGFLAVLGLIAVFIFRRGWPIATAYVFWISVSIAFQVWPNSSAGALIGRFFYSVYTRIQAHVYLLVPVLVAAIFIFAGAAIIGLRVENKIPTWLAPVRPIATFGGIALAVALLAFTTFVGYASTNATALAERYKDPLFVRYSDADRAAAAWLNKHVEAGEVILNNANDGSTLAYTKYGLPIMNINPSGYTDLPYTIELLKCFNTYPDNPRVRQKLLTHNVHWVYVDSQAPLIGSQNAAWGATYSLAPGLVGIDNKTPGLMRAFSAGSVTIYRLNLETVANLPTSGAARDPISQCKYRPAT